MTDQRAGTDLIRNMLEAGRIVGLDPREMTAVALEELQREAEGGRGDLEGEADD